MLPNRLRISKRAGEQFKQLKTRTGITPNILCRLAFTLSIEEGYKPNIESLELDGLEFNLPTLLGEHAALYLAMFRQVHGELNSKQAELMFAAHVDNGADKLKRSKNVLDLFSY